MKFSYFFLFLFFIAESLFAEILVQGHRGSRATHPENTLPAFQEALDAGVDILELDLAITKDGYPVLSHDPYINPILCLDSNGKRFQDKRFIYKMTLEQVKSYDCGSLINPKFPEQKALPNTHIPTLEEVLILASKYPKVKFNIETKIFPFYPMITPEAKLFVKSILKVLKKFNIDNRIIIQSFDNRTLIEVKKQNSNIQISQLLSNNLVDMLALARTLKAEVISPNHKWLTKDMVQQLQKEGIHVAPWTANTQEEWDRLISMEVDSIITDHPRRLIRYLKEKKLR